MVRNFGQLSICFVCFCELEFIVYEYGDCDIEPIIGLSQFFFPHLGEHKAYFDICKCWCLLSYQL